MKPLKLNVSPDIQIEFYQTEVDDFLINNKELAKACDIEKDSIRNIKRRHRDMIIEGIDFKEKYMLTMSGNQRTNMWTKDGAIKIALIVTRDAAKDFARFLENFDPRGHTSERTPQDILLDIYGIINPNEQILQKDKEALTRLFEELRKTF